jgi:hypothetical protein
MAIRIGAEEKKKLGLAVALGVLALGLTTYTLMNLMGGSPPPVAQPVVPAPAQPSSARSSSRAQLGNGHAAQRLESASDLDPSLHPEKMHFAETVEYTGDGRNIFSKYSVPTRIAQAAAAAAKIEQPVAPVRTGPVAPAGPPPPPPIDLKFYGTAIVQNGKTMVFLLHGEDVFVAGEGDIVDHRFQVIKIDKADVVVRDLSYNDNQTLSLQQN